MITGTPTGGLLVLSVFPPPPPPPQALIITVANNNVLITRKRVMSRSCIPMSQEEIIHFYRCYDPVLLSLKSWVWVYSGLVKLFLVISRSLKLLWNMM